MVTKPILDIKLPSTPLYAPHTKNSTPWKTANSNNVVTVNDLILEGLMRTKTITARASSMTMVASITGGLRQYRVVFLGFILIRVF